MNEKIKVLIVEDEALIAESLRMTLEDLGYEVTGTCYSYEEAETAFKTLNADVVLIDINLRADDFRNNGLRLAGKMPADVPFIFLSGYNDLEMIGDATRLKPSGYLIKPFTPAMLFAAIQVAIEKMHLHTEALFSQKVPLESDTENQPDFFFVKVRSERRKIFWKDIAYISAGKNYVKLRSANSEDEYPIRGTLTFVVDQLIPEKLKDTFVRIGRAVSVNRYFVTSYDLNEVTCMGSTFENTRLLLREMHDFFGNSAYALPSVHTTSEESRVVNV